MLDQIKKRDETNRNTATVRRRGERRAAERRGSERRQGERRGASALADQDNPYTGEKDRRRADRRQASRRRSERRTAERRRGERRRDPLRAHRFPRPDSGFLTPKEREFLDSVIRQGADD